MTGRMASQQPLTYFIFDDKLKVVSASPGERWPTAVMAALRSCILETLRDGGSTFKPFGSEQLWHVVPFAGEDRPCIAVYIDV